MNHLMERPDVRPARLADIEALCEIEASAFDPTLYDLLSRRQFKHHLKSETAWLGVFAPPDGKPAGYALVLFRKNTSSARLYSLAVNPSQHGSGIGRALFEWAEVEARRRDSMRLLLEFREDNKRLFEWYSKQGCTPCGRVPAFYPDGTAALKMHRSLRPGGCP